MCLFEEVSIEHAYIDQKECVFTILKCMWIRLDRGTKVKGCREMVLTALAVLIYMGAQAATSKTDTRTNPSRMTTKEEQIIG